MDDAADQATILQLHTKEESMRLLLLHINERVRAGFILCPTCGVRATWKGEYFAPHGVTCVFASLLEQIA